MKKARIRMFTIIFGEIYCKIQRKEDKANDQNSRNG